jgi:threonylcarbamoyladenosine tRNA methylthiotransferase MtaB
MMRSIEFVPLKTEKEKTEKILENLSDLTVSTTAVPTIPPSLAARLERGLVDTDLRPRVAILTLGCKVNYSETEALAENFQQAGYALVDPEGEDKLDVFVVNTCTVTHIAGRKSRQMLRRAKRQNPQALVVATGCHVYTSRGEVEVIKEVDLVVGKAEEERLVELVSDQLNHELSYRPEPLPLLFAGGLTADQQVLTVTGHYRTRAMVKIQDGCNAGCAFCIVPTARGGPRSIGIDEVVAGVRLKVASGYREVVLTGVHLGKYRVSGPDGSSEVRPLRLKALLERIVAEVPIEKLPRLHITSLEPQDYDPTLLDLWQLYPQLDQHFHLALQSGCDATLQRMRRGYNTEKFARIVEQIKRELPDASITTDVIVGFPGETDAEFAQTLAFVEQMGFAKVHVFPFSIREGTLAATMPNQISDAVKKERGEQLRLLADELSSRWHNRFVGQVRPVLWENTEALPLADSSRVWNGLTSNYLRVYTQVSGTLDLHNSIIPTRLIKLASQEGAEGLWGQPLLDDA